MANTIPKAFFAYPSSIPTLKEAIHEAVPELNEEGQVKIRTWEQCNIGGKFVIDTICNAIDESELFLADLTGLNANVMFELGYAIAGGKRIWLILDDTYTKEKYMFEQLKILTTVGYVSCCNSQNIVSGFYKDKPFADIENTIFRAPTEPNLKPGDIFFLKSQHENQASLNMSNLLQERFPKKITVDSLNKPAVQSLADYGNLAFSCSGLVCHFTNPAREDAFLQTARHALICGMAHGFEKPLLMLAEGEFSSPIDYRDFLKHYNTAPQALGYLKEWLPRVEQGLKADQEAVVAPQKIFITYAHQDIEAQKKLKTYFALMEREGKIAFWDDNKIPPSSEWFKNISNNLADSDILLYLVSPRSLASDNCKKELAVALHTEARIIPIILENCDWLNHQLSNFQALPDKGLPINRWQPEEDGWLNVVAGIRKAVDKMQTQAASSSGTSESELRAELAFQQGNVSIMLGQMDKAIERYSHAIKLNPNYTSTYNNRGAAYYKKGKFDLAIADYNMAIRLNPDNAGAYSNRGAVCSKKGEFDHAIADFNKAIQINPGYAEAYNYRGVACDKKGEFDLAIADHTKAVELKPNFAEAYTCRGNAYENRDELDRAITDHNKAIELQPNLVEAYNNRGNAYGKKGNYDRAIADFNRAIELNPDFAEAYNNRGAAYNQKGEYDRAIADLTKVIELKPDDPKAYRDRGAAYNNKGAYELAIGNYEKAMNLKPDDAELYHMRGAAYYSKDEYEFAVADFNRAIELNPNDARAYSDRGMAYYRTANFEHAIADFSYAIQLDPDSVQEYCNRGEAWLHLKHWEKAKSDLMIARDKGLDIIASFRKDYESVEDFEQKNNVKLPEDIVAILTPPAA